MKKVLIITYYYAPYNGIEGNRAKSWFQQLKMYGWEPVVLTRHWGKDHPKIWEDFQAECDQPLNEELLPEGRVYRVPYLKPFLYKNVERIKFIAPLYYWGLKLAGHLHPETNAYHSLKKFAKELLSREKFDAIIVTSPPLNVNRLAYELSKEYNIPAIFDFRDTYNNLLLHNNYRPTLKGRIENFLFRNYVQKWINIGKYVTSTSQPMLDVIQPVKNVKEAVILNGYEKSIFNAIASKTPDNSCFSIAVIGNLYPEQDLDFMISGFRKMIENCVENDYIIQFIGLNHHIVADKVKSELPADKILITNRIAREDALQYMSDAQILYYPAWRGARGIYSGKIFEYLGANRRILIGPGDNDVIDELLQKTNGGTVVYDAESMGNTLIEWYKEWKQNGSLPATVNADMINEYTREAQTEKLIEILNEIAL